MLHLFCVVTQQSYEMPWSSSHPILSSFQPVLPSSQENIHVRRLCSLLGCFVLQRKIQGFSNHARKRWLPAYQFGYMLTLYSKLFNRILFFFFFVTVYCETVKQCWKQETRYPCFLLLLPLCGWTVQNISNFCISRLICSSIPGSCIFHLVL